MTKNNGKIGKLQLIMCIIICAEIEYWYVLCSV